jgi:glycosyltransferase involved in cell wall biosynthesis
MCIGDYQVRENVRVYSVGKEKGYSEPRRAIEFYRILIHLLLQHRYDACFAHMMPLFAVMAAPLLRLRKVPILLWYTHKSVTLTLRLATLLVNRVVTASRESFRINSPKVRVIGHGIDTNTFVPRKNGSSQDRPFTILTVSRLSRIKRIDLVIEAIACLQQQRPELPICLKIVGGPLTENDQKYVAELQQLVEQYGVQETVDFVGSISFQAIVAYYQQADCFVSLSETGSVDKAVLEAMSCEVPVIVNPVFAGVLGGELATKLVIDRDPEQLCDRLLLIASLSKKERRTLGKQLRAIVIRDHTLNSLCQKILHEIGDLRTRIHYGAATMGNNS